MRFLIVDTYYPTFLRDFYASRPELAAQSYASQWRALMDQCFGTANFYSTHLRELGHEAEEVVPNCEPLQRQWARENSVTLDETLRYSLIFRRKVVPWLRRLPRDDWFFTILEAQVKAQRPDVLYVQDMHAIPPFFLQAVRPYVKKIVGQIASPTHPGADFRDYDLILTSFPHFVDRFRQEGLNSEYFRIGFEPKRTDTAHPNGAGRCGLCRRDFFGPFTARSFSGNHRAGAARRLLGLRRRKPPARLAAADALPRGRLGTGDVSSPA